MTTIDAVVTKILRLLLYSVHSLIGSRFYSFSVLKEFLNIIEITYFQNLCENQNLIFFRTEMKNDKKDKYILTCV